MTKHTDTKRLEALRDKLWVWGAEDFNEWDELHTLEDKAKNALGTACPHCGAEKDTNDD